ncbi:hypothetical protein M758_UG312600 [Ceratodon purpureus]|nr:hypothetical protein M758_UG312600 [Ceratodon purpureus]
MMAEEPQRSVTLVPGEIDMLAEIDNDANVVEQTQGSTERVRINGEVEPNDDDVYNSPRADDHDERGNDSRMEDDVDADGGGANQEMDINGLEEDDAPDRLEVHNYNEDDGDGGNLEDEPEMTGPALNSMQEYELNVAHRKIRINSIQILKRLEMFKGKKSHIKIPLCRMRKLQVVRPALENDIIKMQAEFVHGYRDGSAAFYVSTTNFEGQVLDLPLDTRPWYPVPRAKFLDFIHSQEISEAGDEGQRRYKEETPRRRRTADGLLQAINGAMEAKKKSLSPAFTKFLTISNPANGRSFLTEELRN